MSFGSDMADRWEEQGAFKPNPKKIIKKTLCIEVQMSFTEDALEPIMEHMAKFKDEVTLNFSNGRMQVVPEGISKFEFIDGWR